MSAPAISIETVEDIDLTPMCTGGNAHPGASAPAEVIVYQHGCVVHLWCLPCEAHERETFRRVDFGSAFARCKHCKVPLHSFDEAYPRVVPLR